jgi:acetylornithine aminotransferase/acetylornithine/N-succinyldiaminopimelate aminotransferase
MHGTTFGGNPFACAVAIAVIDEIKSSKLLDHVTEIGRYFSDQLSALKANHSAVSAVRGAGLMLGLELHSADLAKTLHAEMLERNILLNRTSETVLRFLPPYLLQREHVDTAVGVLDELLTTHANAGAVLAGEHTNG